MQGSQPHGRFHRWCGQWRLSWISAVTDKTCPHCKGSLAVRNPTGKCDHLYYPENCTTCSKGSDKTREQEAMEIALEIADIHLADLELQHTAIVKCVTHALLSYGQRRERKKGSGRHVRRFGYPSPTRRKGKNDSIPKETCRYRGDSMVEKRRPSP